MKKLLLILAAFICCVYLSHAQLNIGITPSFVLNGFYVGYQFEDFVPYIGLQFFSVSTTFEETQKDYDYDGVLRIHNDKNEISANIYMPYIGGKYFIIKKEALKGYLALGVYKPFVSVEEIDDGRVNNDVESMIDNLSIWGFEFGFGSEYFFNKQFSLGGEFGLRLFFYNSEYKDKTTIYNPNTQRSEESTRELKNNINFSATYAKMSLNYYFGD